jgi:hypothetical protein
MKEGDDPVDDYLVTLGKFPYSLLRLHGSGQVLGTGRQNTSQEACPVGLLIRLR